MAAEWQRASYGVADDLTIDDPLQRGNGFDELVAMPSHVGRPTEIAVRCRRANAARRLARCRRLGGMLLI